MPISSIGHFRAILNCRDEQQKVRGRTEACDLLSLSLVKTQLLTKTRLSPAGNFFGLLHSAQPWPQLPFLAFLTVTTNQKALPPTEQRSSCCCLLTWHRTPRLAPTEHLPSFHKPSQASSSFLPLPNRPESKTRRWLKGVHHRRSSSPTPARPGMTPRLRGSGAACDPRPGSTPSWPRCSPALPVGYVLTCSPPPGLVGSLAPQRDDALVLSSLGLRASPAD